MFLDDGRQPRRARAAQFAIARWLYCQAPVDAYTLHAYDWVSRQRPGDMPIDWDLDNILPQPCDGGRKLPVIVEELGTSRALSGLYTADDEASRLQQEQRQIAFGAGSRRLWVSASGTRRVRGWWTAPLSIHAAGLPRTATSRRAAARATTRGRSLHVTDERRHRKGDVLQQYVTSQTQHRRAPRRDRRPARSRAHRRDAWSSGPAPDRSPSIYIYRLKSHLSMFRIPRRCRRVAVITDIHGNLPALEGGAGAIDAIGVDGVYCGGDLVGYGPCTRTRSAALIEERGIPTIYGNYDYAIARDEEDCGCAYVTQHDRELGQLSVDWTLEHTDQRSKDFMRGLPFDLRFELGGKQVRLVHGSPRKVNEYLFEDKPAQTFRADRGRRADCDMLVFGHTHKPWIAEYGGVLLRELRLGRKAQGRRPARRLRGPRARRRRRVAARIERFDYDAEAVAREVAAAGLPGEFAEKLCRPPHSEGGYPR